MNILESIAAIRKDLSNMMDVLNSIRVVLKEAKKDVKIAGKTLRHANIEQPAQYGYYDEIRVHLQSLSDYLEIKVAQRRAVVIKIITEQSLDYGERLKEKLVDEDEVYIDWKLKKLEADEVLELAKSVGKQFEQRGYTLRNITNLVAAQAQDEHLMLSENG